MSIRTLFAFLLAMPVALAQTAVVQTNFGSFEVTLYGADAPKTVKNFVELTKQGYFDGTLVHRISRDFVIQMGDPLTRDTTKRRAWGSGGLSIYGKEFEDELNDTTPSYQTGYEQGVVAMANRGPNTNTSQFFVLLADQTNWMPHKYTIFGRVSAGMDVVTKIGEQPIAGGQSDGPPADPIRVEKVSIK